MIVSKEFSKIDTLGLELEQYRKKTCDMQWYKLKEVIEERIQYICPNFQLYVFGQYRKLFGICIGINMKIRAHHLLCMQLYEGKGYNDNFCKGMEHVIEELRKNNSYFTLHKETDVICENCPNRMNETECRLGNEDVEIKDIKVMHALNLEFNEMVTYKTINKVLETKIDVYNFSNICGTCRWFRENICNYDKWKNSFTK